MELWPFYPCEVLAFNGTHTGSLESDSKALADYYMRKLRQCFASASGRGGPYRGIRIEVLANDYVERGAECQDMEEARFDLQQILYEIADVYDASGDDANRHQAKIIAAAASMLTPPKRRRE